MGLYSHYDGAHNHPLNRALHMIAIPVGFSSLVVVWWHWLIALLLIPTAFALAWLGHLIEGNKPAFLTSPVHVFVAPVWLARSCCSRRLPTVQPTLSWPSSASLGATASVKKVSQNGELPAISLIGRVSTPG